MSNQKILLKDKDDNVIYTSDKGYDLTDENNVLKIIYDFFKIINMDTEIYDHAAENNIIKFTNTSIEDMKIYNFGCAKKSGVSENFYLPLNTNYSNLKNIFKRYLNLNDDNMVIFYTDSSFKKQDIDTNIPDKNNTIYYEIIDAKNLEQKFFARLKSGKKTEGYNFKENLNIISYKKEENFDNLIGSNKLIKDLNGIEGIKMDRNELAYTLGVIYDIIFIRIEYITDKMYKDIDNILNKYIYMNLDKYFCIINYEKANEHIYPIFINFKQKSIYVLDAFRPEGEKLYDYGIERDGYYYYFDYKDEKPYIETVLTYVYNEKEEMLKNISDFKQRLLFIFLADKGITLKLSYSSREGKYKYNNNLMEPNSMLEVNDDKLETKKYTLIISSDNKLSIIENKNKIYDETEYITIENFNKILVKYKGFFEKYEYIKFIESNDTKHKYFKNIRSSRNWLVSLILKKLDIQESNYKYFSSAEKLQTNSQTCGIISAYIVNTFFNAKNLTDIIQTLQDIILVNEKILKEGTKVEKIDLLKNIFECNDENIKGIFYSTKSETI